MKRTASKKLAGCVLVACLALAGLGVGWVPGSGRAGEIRNGPLIQQVTADSFSVVWWHPSEEEAELRLRGGGTTGTRFPAVRRDDRYEARATGLEAGITYWYELAQIGANGSARRIFAGQASTAKPPGASCAFIVFADSGSGEQAQYDLAQLMEQYPADFILHGGDLIYESGALDDYHEKFFSPYRNLIETIPFYPVMGNHDVRTDDGRPFLEIFSLPTNGPPRVAAERCYWFDYGDARFVGIDSTLDSMTLANAVVPWLGEVMESSTRTWKIVFFHHPPWAGGRRSADLKIQAALVPSLEASDVDLVFCAHNHLYERTHPIRPGEISTADGVRYITTGAGGKSLHQKEPRADPQIAAFNDAMYSFTWINIDGPRLDLMQIGEADIVLDQVVLRKNDIRDPGLLEHE